MTIANSLYFVLGGKRSNEMGLINVSIDTSGMVEELLVGSREVKQQFIRGRTKPYFMEVLKSPPILSLQFAFEEGFDENRLREVSNWLFADKYQEMYFSDNIDRRFFVVAQGDSRLIHNGYNQGYLQLEFICNDYYQYSPEYNDYFNLRNNSSEGTVIEIKNLGDTLLYPKMKIEMVNDEPFSIFNLTNRNQEFKLTSLKKDEIVYVDCEEEEIYSSLPDTYRYDDHNDEFLELVYGVNRLKVIGKCNLHFLYRYKLLSG